MKTILIALVSFAAFSAQAQNLGQIFGGIKQVITEVQEIQDMTNKDKPHTCYIDTSFYGVYQASGATEPAARANVANACTMAGVSWVYCQPESAQCELINYGNQYGGGYQNHNGSYQPGQEVAP
jgi:hypothetical protein